ncbi:MAG: hypothetical protein D3M94_18250 [Rhodocyclales bacterium GT-UBC]|nr:MAG: hypothetical protein D3M94_18250 [Rhodocyclales bacterium GT-UBC]
MKRTLLVAALLAVALAACSKKEETTTALPAPATPPTLPTATADTPTNNIKPTEGITLNAPAEEKPAAESKPAN